MIFIHTPVGEDHDINAIPVSTVHFHKQSVNGPLKAGIFIINDGDDLHFKPVFFHALDLHQIRVGQYGIIYPQHPAVFRYLFQNVSVRPDINCGGRDNFLPDGINRGIRHLGKQLLKIME